jgi:hypothetical protein
LSPGVLRQLEKALWEQVTKLSNLILSQLDDKVLYALRQYDINPISVQVKESYNPSTQGKKLYQLFFNDTIMDYEIKAIEEQGFKLMWVNISRNFGRLDCSLEVTFKEQ